MYFEWHSTSNTMSVGRWKKGYNYIYKYIYYDKLNNVMFILLFSRWMWRHYLGVLRLVNNVYTRLKIGSSVDRLIKPNLINTLHGLYYAVIIHNYIVIDLDVVFLHWWELFNEDLVTVIDVSLITPLDLELLELLVSARNKWKVFKSCEIWQNVQSNIYKPILLASLAF